MGIEVREAVEVVGLPYEKKGDYRFVEELIYFSSSNISAKSRLIRNIYIPPMESSGHLSGEIISVYLIGAQLSPYSLLAGVIAPHILSPPQLKLQEARSRQLPVA